MYVRLAVHEEAEARATFGDKWETYAAKTPRFFPRFGRRVESWPPMHSQGPV